MDHPQIQALVDKKLEEQTRQHAKETDELRLQVDHYKQLLAQSKRKSEHYTHLIGTLEAEKRGLTE